MINNVYGLANYIINHVVVGPTFIEIKSDEYVSRGDGIHKMLHIITKWH